MSLTTVVLLGLAVGLPVGVALGAAAVVLYFVFSFWDIMP